LLIHLRTVIKYQNSQYKEADQISVKYIARSTPAGLDIGAESCKPKVAELPEAATAFIAARTILHDDKIR